MANILIDSNDNTYVNGLGKAVTSEIPVITTVTDTLPQTLTTVAGNIKQLIRYGHISQANTPTPTSPSPLICNCGEVNEGMFELLIPGEKEDECEVIDPVYTAETLTLSSGGSSQTVAIPPLLAIKDGLTDVYDVQTGIVMPNAVLVVLDGTESWGISSGTLSLVRSDIAAGSLV